MIYHATFTIERTFTASPAHVFRAWSEIDFKHRWFASGGTWRSENHTLDFRIGGHETLDSYPPDGTAPHFYRATYLDIVPDQRIIYSFVMSIDAQPVSISLATIVLDAVSEGTRLTFTEQFAIVNAPANPAARETGTRLSFDALARELRNR